MAKRLSTGDFITELAKQPDIASKAAANRIYKEFVSIISKQMSKGNALALTGLGTFSTTKVPERPGVNPSTGAKITIPKHNRAKLKFGSAIKQAIN